VSLVKAAVIEKLAETFIVCETMFRLGEVVGN
jgi:hypothetical protein